MTNRGREEQEPGEDSPQAQRQEKRERAVADALRSLVRDAVTGEMDMTPLAGKELDLEIALKVKPRAEGPWDLTFDPPLHEQVAEQGAGLAAAHGVYEEGSVYCFRCQSSRCEHAEPPSSLMVFKHYHATGYPEWHELSQALLDARDERVDQLHGARPRVVSLVTRGNELRQEQLTSFGKRSKTYAILGQVAVGYLPLEHDRHATSSETHRLAVTYQAVEVRPKRGAFSLRLNPVCSIPGSGRLDELYAEGWGSWVRRAELQAQEALARVEREVFRAREAKDNAAIRRAMGRIPEILRKCGASMERGYRQSSRRTQHAEKRREQQRPVHMAFHDLSRAGKEDLLKDVRSGTIIVVGEKRRIHAFTEDARHVTSFVAKEESILARQGSGRWRPLEEEPAAAFLERVSASVT